MVLVAAYAHELPRYGLEVGVTNYVAGYWISQLNLLKVGGLSGNSWMLALYELQLAIVFLVLSREHWMVDLTSHIATRDLLESTRRASNLIPRFIVKNLICSPNVQTLMEDAPKKYQAHFSEYIMRGINEDGLEEMYKKVHAAIRVDPTLMKSEKQPPKEQ
ncbi:60S ribosomal protein L5-2 [Abeliophyllum distichum]|uniref:60S ribosomal protein L5-2 n=1 Tax=Abeliophyllum distichum TaxID=126358 RepID=A0ABD1TIT9_9LAMI